MRDIAYESRCSPLVGNDTDGFSFTKFISNQLQNIAMLAGKCFSINYNDTDNRIIATIFRYSLFAFVFGNTIIIDRIRLVFFRINLDKQGAIFGRFEKLNEGMQGTGLGLSICKLIINRLGGEIWVDPAYTSGARLAFTHPLKQKGE